MREIEIDKLKEQLCSQPSQKPSSYSHTSISVQSAMSRMERETEALKSKIAQISTERDDLKENLKSVLNDLHNDQLSYTSEILQLNDQIKKLENEIRCLRDTQLTGTSNESRILRMTEKIDEYSRQLEELGMENRKLKSSYSQIKYAKRKVFLFLFCSLTRFVFLQNTPRAN